MQTASKNMIVSHWLNWFTVEKKKFLLMISRKQSVRWPVQTPQVFRRELYEQAADYARRCGGDYTDDCQLAEQAGIPVHLCDGDATNLKITTPEDLVIAEAILRSWGEEYADRTWI